MIYLLMKCWVNVPKHIGWLQKIEIVSHNFHLFLQILCFWLGCSQEGWLATQSTPPGSKHLHIYCQLLLTSGENKA